MNCLIYLTKFNFHFVANISGYVFFYFFCNSFSLSFQGEIGRRSGGDNVLEREGYAVSAGFSLGLVALGMVILVYRFFKLQS